MRFPTPRHTAGIFLMTAAVLLGACAEKRTSSQVSGLTTHALWTKRHLIGCWDHAGAPSLGDHAALEASIAQDVTRAYTVPLTGIAITLLNQDCAQTPEADVAVGWEMNGFVPGGSGIASQVGQLIMPPDPESQQIFAGTRLPMVKLGGTGFAQLASTYRPGITLAMAMSQIALHEFGHIAGLFHEHAHPRSTCHVTPESALNKYADMGPAANNAYLDNGSAYDPYSIMNYCDMYAVLNGQFEDPALDPSRVALGHSQADRDFLKAMYASLPDDSTDTQATTTANATSSSTPAAPVSPGSTNRPEDLSRFDRNPS